MRTIPAMWFLVAALVTSRALGADAPKSQKFDSNGVKIQYTVEGKGEPVVLIHGLYATADINWRLPGITKALAANYQVISFDARGHGQSDKPDKEEAYGEEMAEDVVRLLDHLKIEKAHLIGYSMGGMITMKVVVKHPDRVQTAVLGGMGWLKEGSPLQNFWGRIPERGGAITPNACLRSLAKLAVTEDEVKAIKIPVAILVGDRDPCRRMYVGPLEKVRSDWPVTVIDGAGHINCILKPQFREDLVKTLDKQMGK